MGRSFKSLKNRRDRLPFKILFFSVGLLVTIVYTAVKAKTGFDLGFLSNGNEVSINAPDGVLLTSSSALPSEDRALMTDDEPIECKGVDAETCKVLDDKLWLVALIAGLLYLFVGIAIVCDELFVPALEIIAERWHLSNDVAGATLMAAGGSAPELATSFVGTFKRSDVGFGTIVGSAVFNVLFVIGMCAMFTPKEFAPLSLTWWPLFRDCSYYIITLSALAVVMYDQKVLWWEALIQFSLYFGYVILMYYSERLEKWVKSFKKSEASTPEDGDVELAKTGSLDLNADFNRSSTFRAGVLQLLTDGSTILETAGIACVAKIKGDVNQVFDELDENKNGVLDHDELKKLLQSLGTLDADLTDEHVKIVAKQIDGDSDGVITRTEFVKWYSVSEDRVKTRMKEVFDKFDRNSDGIIEQTEIKDMLLALGNRPSADELEEAEKEITKNGKDGGINYDNFVEWYQNSLFWSAQKVGSEEEEDPDPLWDTIMEGCGGLCSSEGTFRSKIMFLFTLPLVLCCCLIPDCRQEGKEWKSYMTFIGSIVGVGILSFFMVELAEYIGATLGIPDVVMGIVFLAAGTSVPDLLSSVIVAKQGEGDMAVSSSIGSNVFDVSVGLPLPWLVYSIYIMQMDCKDPVLVDSEGLFESLLILVVMVALIVIIIAVSDWKMTHTLGYAMFFLYFAYVAVALIRTPRELFVVPDCESP